MGWQWHQLDHMQIIRTSLETDNHTSTSSLNFYRLDALPDAQPTVSKHWRQDLTISADKKLPPLLFIHTPYLTSTLTCGILYTAVV